MVTIKKMKKIADAICFLQPHVARKISIRISREEKVDGVLVTNLVGRKKVRLV